jgi:hypothetical protein
VAETLFQFFIFDFKIFSFFVILKALETNSALQAINAMEKSKKFNISSKNLEFFSQQIRYIELIGHFKFLRKNFLRKKWKISKMLSRPY